MTEYADEVERRLGRSFDEVREQLEQMFDRDWDDVAIVIETAASKSGRSHADVVVDLVGRAERKPAPQERVRRSVIRWVGKPWRERENPWDRFKHRIPRPPPPTDARPEDLDEWSPPRPEED